MVVIPLVLALAVFHAGLYFYTTATGIRDSRAFKSGQRFFAMRTRLAKMAASWRALPEDEQFAAMVRGIDSFNEERGGEWPMMMLFRDGVLVFPHVRPFGGLPFETAAYAEAGSLVMGGTSIFVERVGGYSPMLVDARVGMHDERIDFNYVMNVGLIFAGVASVLIILITNRVLTRFVFRGIVSSLDSLSSGVREIRDGNLSHRISYANDDEFASVVADFNEMASRLEESIEARSRDERSRRELIAGISHDLRTPLTSIKAYVEGLMTGVASDDEVRARYLATIKNKADDLEHIISMLFLFAKLDTGEFPYVMERADVFALARDIAADLATELATTHPNATISFEADRTPARAMIDRVQFASVMTNVVGNAIKYSGRDDVSVIIRCAVRDEIEISIDDDGRGVPAGELDKIFDVFYRVDPARREPSKGSGLGLAISKKIISHFGGSISARASERGGLAIDISLPADGGEEI